MIMYQIRKKVIYMQEYILYQHCYPWPSAATEQERSNCLFRLLTLEVVSCPSLAMLFRQLRRACMSSAELSLST